MGSPAAMRILLWKREIGRRERGSINWEHSSRMQMSNRWPTKASRPELAQVTPTWQTKCQRSRRQRRFHPEGGVKPHIIIIYNKKE